MSRYVSLSANTYLSWYRERGLDSGFKDVAEAEADAWLDQQFARWDRSEWTLGLPGLSTVLRAGQLYGASEYVQLDHMEHRPDLPSAGEGLRTRAQEMVDSIIARGMYNDSGELQSPTSPGGAGSFAIEVNF